MNILIITLVIIAAAVLVHVLFNVVFRLVTVYEYERGLRYQPALLQLRLLQGIGQTSGNTVVLGMGGQPQTIPLRQSVSGSAPGELPPSDQSGE